MTVIYLTKHGVKYEGAGGDAGISREITSSISRTLAQQETGLEKEEVQEE